MIADRELETWLVVDMSASLDFGTACCEKRDLAVAAAAITFLNSGGGNRLGALIANGAAMTRVPARTGRQHQHTMLRTIATMPQAPAGSAATWRLPSMRCAGPNVVAGWR